VVRNGIDREITPGQIFFQRNAVLDHRMASVSGHVAPEGGDLVEHPIWIQDAHRPVLDSDRHSAREQPLNLLRGG
jgi:hypothetical protein